jgi:hypothetical protein
MATIGALIYKLGLDISELTTNVKSVDSKLSSLGGMATKAGAALGGMLAIGGVAQAVSAYTEFTGRIADLAAQTGMSTTAVQKLEYAATQSGGSFDQVASGITQMANRLVGGDKSAVAGLRTMGLSFEDVRKMAPDQAFMTIADAIAKVPNPLEQSSLAMDVFGKSGAKLLPMIKNGLSETAAEAEKLGLVLSEDAIAAGDEFGDTLDKLKLVGMSLISSVLTPLVPILSLVANAVVWLADKLELGLNFVIRGTIAVAAQAMAKLYELAAAASELALKYAGPVARSLGLTSETVQGLRAQATHFSDVARRQADLAISAEKAAPATTQLAAAIRTTAPASQDAAKALEAFQKKVDDATGMSAYQGALEAMRVIEAAGNKIDPEKFMELAKQVRAGVDAAGRLGIAVSDAMAQVATSFVEAGPPVQNFLEDLLRVNATIERMPFFSTNVKNLPAYLPLPKAPDTSPFSSLIEKAMQKPLFSGLGAGFLGKGGVLETQFKNILSGNVGVVFSAVGQQFGTNLVTKFGQTITTTLGKTIGGAINSLLPGVGALLGPLATKVGGWITGIFTGGEGAKVNDLRDKFIAAAGGLEALNQKAVTAGTSLDALLRANKVSDFEAAVAALNTRLEATAKIQGEIDALRQQLADRQVMDWEKAQQLIERYGGTLGNLGQAFEAAKQAANWQTIWDDWQTLIDMGADVGGVLVSMKDEIGALVGQSMRIGTEIPAQFRPLIEELLRTGQLFTETGTQITDISGLTFGAPLVSEVDKLITKLDELIQALRGPQGVADALAQIPDRLHVKIGVDWEVPDFPAGTPGAAYHTGGLVSSARRFTGATAVPWSAMRMHAGGEVPAWLQPGEYVVSRRGVQALGLATLGALNTGQLRGGGPGPAVSREANAEALTTGLLAEIQRLPTELAARQSSTITRSLRDALLLAK